jgi:hypothetical protein
LIIQSELSVATFIVSNSMMVVMVLMAVVVVVVVPVMFL